MENKKLVISTSENVDENDVTTWALPEGAIARLGRGDVNDIAFSPDGQSLAIATDIGTWLYTLPELAAVALWDTENGHSGIVTFSPDSRWLAIYSDNEEAFKVWDVQRGACVALMEDSYQQDSSRPIFSRDSQHIFNSTLRWCVQTGALLDETDLWHPHPTNAAAYFTFSADGNLVIGERFIPNNDHTEIVVWNAGTGEQVVVLSENGDGHELVWWNPCFSPCERYLAASDSHGTIQVWDLESGTLLNTYTGYGDAKMFPCYLPMGNLIAAVILPQKVEIWDVEKHEMLDEFKINNEYVNNEYVNRHIVRFSDDGTRLAVAIPNQLKLWTKGKNGCHTLTTLNGHTNTADCVAFSSDGKTLAAAYWDANVILWEVASKHALSPDGEKLRGTAHAVYLSANGQFIVTGGDDKDTLWISEIGNPEPVAEFTAPWLGSRQPKACSHTANRLACADDEFNIHVWEYTNSQKNGIQTKGWRKHRTLVGHTTYIRDLAFKPDGTQLASISCSVEDPSSGNARLWDVNTGEQIAELVLTSSFLNPEDMYRKWDLGVAFSPCGNLIAGGQWGEIVLWDATNGSTITTLPQPKGSQRPIALCFSPCGQYLASGAWWQSELKLVPIRLWEIASKKNVVTFWSHTTDVQHLQFSPDGTLLASAGHDGVVFLWDMTPYLL